MDALMACCMYLAVQRTPPKSPSEDRARLVRAAREYAHEGMPTDVAPWLAALDGMVRDGQVLRTKGGYLTTRSADERYQSMGVYLYRLGSALRGWT